MNIVFNLISSFQLEFLLLHGKTNKNFTLIAFYMNDIFETFKTYQKQYIFLYDHFFPHIFWFRLKFILSKLKIEITKIFALRKKHEISKKIRLKLDRIEKIFIWPVF